MGARTHQPGGRTGFTQTRREAETPRQIKHPPHISIGRAVHLDTVQKEEWRTYLEKMGRINRHLDVKNLGGMAVTYVQNGELNAMLAQKYPHSYTTSGEIRDIHRGLAKEFQSFVVSMCKAVCEGRELVIYGERFGRTPQHSDLQLPDDPRKDMWQTAPVTVRPNLRQAGNYSLAASLVNNEFLNEEMDQIVTDFLKLDQGLSPKFLVPGNHKPHLTLIDTEPRLLTEANLSLNALGLPPSEITLAAPSMSYEAARIKAGQVSSIPVL